MPDSSCQNQLSKNRSTSEAAPQFPAAMAGGSLSPPLGKWEEGQRNSNAENCGIGSPATQDKNDAKTSDTESEFVTYVIVVHGIGEQRKNETVISVVNRFAEARRAAAEDDNRDVLTLGQASGQTGLSKVPTTEQPWMEFDGIPQGPTGHHQNIFLGEPSSTGDNLRFVDLCWSDIMQDSMPKVVQKVDVWAKGLLGRLLRKHEDATQPDAEVPFWIRRVLFLLVDTLLLLRFCMKFRFKEMEELIFAKFLGDVQQYGEYARCRGGAVRRFHETMAKIEAEHYSREKGRKVERDPRYVVIAHSLGSIMSFDALLYAHATPRVRNSHKEGWAFPGYIRVDDKVNEADAINRLCELRRKAKRSAPENEELNNLEEKFLFLDSKWIWRVESFVTLGSPIDKYLMLWWLNYRYLLNHHEWFERIESKVQPCHCIGPVRKSLINHLNYCDELDPVGHNLDVAKQTKAYRAVFKSNDDIVFNRYTVPGAAHNKYWEDQGLFKWILARAVDRTVETPPNWFNRRAYRALLCRIYSWAPWAVIASTFFTVSLALLAHSWHTVGTAAVVFAVVVLLGRRLIDLSIWWRQIQRNKSSKLWEDLADRGHTVDQWLPDATDKKRQCVKKEMNKLAQNRGKKAKRYQYRIRLSPWLGMVATTVLTWCGFGFNVGQNWFIDYFPPFIEGWVGKLAMVMVLSGLVVLAYSRFFVLPDAYRTSASTHDAYSAEWQTACLAVLLPVVAGWVLNYFFPGLWSNYLGNHEFIMRHLILLSFLITTAYTYRWRRFMIAKKKVGKRSLPVINYDVYANHP